MSTAHPHVVQVLYSGLGGHASVAFSLIAGDRDNAWRQGLLFVGIEPLVPAYGVFCRERGLSFDTILTTAGKPWASWRAVYLALRARRPDVVLLHSVSYLVPAALYCLLHPARLVSVLHTPLALRSRGERLMASLAVMAGAIVVLTEAYREAYAATLGMLKPLARINVIPNGIDVQAFSREHGGAAPSGKVAFRIGMAARFSSTKRQDVLVQAIALLSRQSPHIPWQLTLAGDGEQYQRVRDLAEREGVMDRVVFAGHLDEGGLLDWYASLDLYAHASEGEALSTSMLQAMAMALPLVASDVPGISNLLGQEPPFGELIRQNTGPAFAAGIQTLQADPARRLRLGSEARARAVRSYSHQTMFDSYNTIVQER